MISSKEAFFALVCLLIPIVVILNAIKRKSLLHIVLTLLFMTYIAGIIAVTMFPIPTDNRLIELYRDEIFTPKYNFIPFHSIMNVLNHEHFIVGLKNIGGNILLLLPLGIIAGIKTFSSRISISILTGLVFSMAIELTQLILTENHLIFRRSVDVDDLILNTFGYSIGYFATIGLSRSIARE
jgi:glycopeptide antibiotics resistance protein